MLHKLVEPEVYHNCYKPQYRMRIIFTGYAINSAGVCFILTMALIMCDEMSQTFERIVNWVSEYMYFLFGPVLFTFCLFGLANMQAIMSECQPDS